jgi:hypothetical protein
VNQANGKSCQKEGPMDLVDVVATLRDEVAQLNEAIEIIEGVLAARGQKSQSLSQRRLETRGSPGEAAAQPDQSPESE